MHWACEIGRTENTVIACSCVLRVILSHEPIFGWGVPHACGRALDQPSVQDASCTCQALECQVFFRNAQRWACEIGRTENTVVACSCVLRVIIAHEPIFGWGVPNACGRALDQPSVQDASCIRLDEIFCILILYLVFLFSFFSLFCHLFLGWCYISAVFE